jgi:hypothetical protein
MQASSEYPPVREVYVFALKLAGLISAARSSLFVSNDELALGAQHSLSRLCREQV